MKLFTNSIAAPSALLLLLTTSLHGASLYKNSSAHFSPGSGLDFSTAGSYDYWFVGGSSLDIGNPIIDFDMDWFTEESGSQITTRGTASAFDYSGRYPNCSDGLTSTSDSDNYGVGSYAAYQSAAISTFFAEFSGSLSTQNITATGFSNSYIQTGSYTVTGVSDSSSCTPQHTGDYWGAYYHVHLEWDGTGSAPSYGSTGSAGLDFWQVEPNVSITHAGNASDNYFGGTYSGGFFVRRCDGDNSSPLTVYYTISGTATNGTDYNTIGTSVTIAAGSSRKAINIVPPSNDPLDGTETVIITLSPNSAYVLGNGCYGGATTQTVYIYNN